MWILCRTNSVWNVRVPLLRLVTLTRLYYSEIHEYLGISLRRLLRAIRYCVFVLYMHPALSRLLHNGLVFVSLCRNVCFRLFDVFGVFMLINAELCSSFQFSLLFFDSRFFFSNGRNGSESSASFGINFVRWWTLPRNDLSCFSVLGFSSFMIVSVFVIRGVIPFGVIVNPSHSIVFFANTHSYRLIARPSLSSVSSILSNSCSCTDMVTLVMTRISSRNANFENMPSKVLSIVFWKVAGMSVKP